MNIMKKCKVLDQNGSDRIDGENRGKRDDEVLNSLDVQILQTNAFRETAFCLIFNIMLVKRNVRSGFHLVVSISCLPFL